jgi:hypothetical protein
MKYSRFSHAKYFFIKDRIEGGEMRVVKCQIREKLMNCDKKYEDNELTETRGKSASVKMTKHGSTQNLLECVGRSGISQLNLEAARQPISAATKSPG